MPSETKAVKRAALLAVALTTAIGLAACATPATPVASPSPTMQATSDEDRYGSKDKPITLTVWSWGGGDTSVIEKAYEKLHPYVDLKITQFGSSGDVYTKLAVTLKAGDGAPDLTSMELMNMPSFAVQGGLLDLSQYGGSTKDFNASAAAAASFNGKLYAIPTDTGPLVMYYNSKLFKNLNIEVPATWDQYRAAAETLKKSGHFIANMDPGDPSLTMGLLQQADSHPFKLSGSSDLNVDFNDAGANQYSDYWSAMLKDGFVKAEPGWSQQWFNRLADGTYATWLTGAWGASVLSGSIKQAAGDWRVALLPNWSADKSSNGVWGGSGTAVTVQSKHPFAATAYAQWFAEDQFLGQLDNAANMPFPASQKVLDDPRYVNAASEFLGGQKTGSLYIEASKSVNSTWQFLPFQLYANTIYKDTFGQHVDGDQNLMAGLKAWQEKIVAYGKDQGFNVTGG